MENASHALYMAFAVMVLIIAFTYSLYLVNILNSTAKTLVYRLDEKNYYDSLALTDLIDKDDNSNAYKVVTIDSIVPTLYRYYKESFCVKIVDKNGNLLQMFDTTVEGNIMEATAKIASQRTDEQKAILDLYGNADESCYLFGAPWIGSTEDTKERIDLYINGGAGYINNVYVNYSTDGPSEGGLSKYKDNNFKEIFTQYAYEGDTISSYSSDGEIDETLTGTAQISTKIVITYQIVD